MGRRSALLIGTQEYEDPAFAALKAPNADVLGLAAVLRAKEICGFDEVSTMLDASWSDVRVGVSEFFGKGAGDDLLVLYFTGHGMLDEQGRLFLCLRNTQKRLLRATALSASSIRDEMDNTRTRKQLLVLDCCHSGAFARDTKGAPIGTSVGTMTSFEGSGLGRVVLTATDATQFAFQGDRVLGTSKQSLFTHYLIEGLQSGRADIDGDGRITIDELYNYAYERVVRDTPGQTPGKWTYKQQGDITLARNPHPIPLPELIDAGLRESILPGKPRSIREAAVREMIALLKDRRPGVALAAQTLLGPLAQDDSRVISELANKALESTSDAPMAPSVAIPRLGDSIVRPWSRSHVLVGTPKATMRLAAVAAVALFGLGTYGADHFRQSKVVGAGIAQFESVPPKITASINIAPVPPRPPEVTTSVPLPTPAPSMPVVVLDPSAHSPVVPPKRTPPAVVVTAFVASGEVAPSALTAFKSNLTRRFATCSPPAKTTGSVTFRFTVDATGAVTTPERHKDTTLSPELISCLARALKAMSFGATAADAQMVVRATFQD